MRHLFSMSLAVCLTVSFIPAYSQNYPNRSIRIVVPTSAGGSSDTLGRLISGKLHERYGQPITVENRPGAGQMIGADHVSKSAPDGYTLIFLGGTYTTSAAIRARLPFDPVDDLTGVAKVGEGPFMLVVHPSLPVTSVRQLLGLAKAKPGQLDYATAGEGSITHLVTAVFASMANINITHVSYKSGSPAATDVVGGHVPMMIGSLPLVMSHVKENRLRGLAVTTASRSSLAPEFPTVAESGVPGFEASQWWGMLAPSKVPGSIVEALNNEINKILETSDVRKSLAVAGAVPVRMTAQAFSNLVKSEIQKWRKIVTELNIKRR